MFAKTFRAAVACGSERFGRIGNVAEVVFEIWGWVEGWCAGVGVEEGEGR